MILIDFLNKKANHLAQRDLLTNVYGFARVVIAIGTLITFIFNNSTILFSNQLYHYNSLGNDFLTRINFFSLFIDHLNLARIIAIGILLSVIAGWRPRITGIFHWYITYSFYQSCNYLDGGDQIASILSLFLIPFCLLDNRKWIWEKHRTVLKSYWNIFLNILYFVIRLQVCIIYFQAGIAKMGVTEWVNGTAIYYWSANSSYGAPDWLRPFVISVLSNAYLVVLITWGTMIFEVILGMSIMMKRNNWNWKILLVIGILFHFGIIIIHGLISFFFSMTACLILYLYPLDQNIRFNRLMTFLKPSYTP